MLLLQDAAPTSEVADALRRLRAAIQEGGNKGPHSQGLDRESVDFLAAWLQNNKPSPETQPWWKTEAPAVHDLSRLEERMLGMEAEKDSLQLQVKKLP